MIMFFFKYVFIYLFKCRITQRKRGSKRKVFRWLVHFPDYYNGWSWCMLKPGTQYFIQVSHVGARHPSAWTTFHCLLRCVTRSWAGSGSRTQTNNPIWDASITDGRFTCCTTVLSWVTFFSHGIFMCLEEFKQVLQRFFFRIFSHLPLYSLKLLCQHNVNKVTWRYASYRQ